MNDKPAPRKPKRFKNAIDIQKGAGNPSGIMHTLLDAFVEIRTGQEYTGTASLTHDPAVRLMVHQLAFICGVVGTVHDLQWPSNYSDTHAECEARDAGYTVTKVSNDFGG